jgi:hypothetical protein
MILFSVWTAIIVIVDDDNINVDGHWSVVLQSFSSHGKIANKATFSSFYLSPFQTKQQSKRKSCCSNKNIEQKSSGIITWFSFLGKCLPRFLWSHGVTQIPFWRLDYVMHCEDLGEAPRRWICVCACKVYVEISWKGQKERIMEEEDPYFTSFACNDSVMDSRWFITANFAWNYFYLCCGFQIASWNDESDIEEKGRTERNQM